MSDDPAIGTVELIIGLKQALKIWRYGQNGAAVKRSGWEEFEQAAGKLLARWLLAGGQSPNWRDADERYRFAAWCEVHGIMPASKMGKVLRLRQKRDGVTA